MVIIADFIIHSFQTALFGYLIILSSLGTAPLFTKSLSKVSATEGKPCQLSVQFSGTPEPDVQWYRNGQPLRKDSRHNITRNADSSTLIIRNAGISDGGLYSVKAINSAGSATCQGEIFIESMHSIFMS